MYRGSEWAFGPSLNSCTGFKAVRYVYYRSHRWKLNVLLLLLVFTVMSLLPRGFRSVHNSGISSCCESDAGDGSLPAAISLARFDTEYVKGMRTTKYEDAMQRPWSGPGAEHVELFHALLSLEQGGLYVDVGANAGILLTYAAMMGHPTIGIEAISQNYDKLLNIIRENRYQKNVRVVHAAAAEVSGKIVAFKENIVQWTNSSQRNGQQMSPGESFDGVDLLQYTTTVALDDLVDANITLLKLDVEGTEFLALSGAKRLFSQRTVRYVHFEFSPANMASLSGQHSPLQCLRFLQNHGYSIYIEDCSHDISAAAISELPAKCAKQSDAEYAVKFQNREHSSIESYELKVDDFGDFLEIMLKHSANGSMLVNLLAILQ